MTDAAAQPLVTHKTLHQACGSRQATTTPGLRLRRPQPGPRTPTDILAVAELNPRELDASSVDWAATPRRFPVSSSGADILSAKISHGFELLDADGDGGPTGQVKGLMGRRVPAGLGHPPGSAQEQRIIEAYRTIWGDLH